MNSTNFVYWLQGWVEIEQPNAVLDRKKIDCIRNHLNLVYKYELANVNSRDMTPIQAFCYELKEELTMKEAISPLLMNGIKAQLNSLFEHEIDPKVYANSENMEEFNIAHNGGYLYGDPTIKC